MPECYHRNGYTTFGMGKLFHSQPEPDRKKAMWDNDVWGGGFGPFPSEAAIEFLERDHDNQPIAHELGDKDKQNELQQPHIKGSRCSG